MKIFHSSYEIIEKPELRVGRQNADFGPGFYLSQEQEFTLRWSKCTEGKVSYVNIYDLDTTGLNIKHLQRDMEWFDYISQNRSGRGDCFCDFDVIIGPIANDTLYDVFGIPTSGMLSKDLSLALLQLGGEYHQVVLKSEKALSQLTWLGADEVDFDMASRYREMVLAETEAYQVKFQRCLEEEDL